MARAGAPAGEEIGFAREVAEAALAHVIGDAAEEAYRRGDALEKRRKLMEAWADYCGQAVNSKVPAPMGATSSQSASALLALKN